MQLKNYTPKSFEKKLGSYTAMAGAFIALAPEAQADVIYTDVDPDMVVTLGNFADTVITLDINNDAIVDFAIIGERSVYSVGSNYAILSVEGYVDNYVIGASATIMTSISYTSFYDAFALDNGAVIGPAGPWITSAYLGVDYVTSSTNIVAGQWLGQTDKYLGLKFVINGEFHYGWVRMDVAADATSFTIKGYAYEDVPNTPITAGNITSIEETRTWQSVSVYSHESNLFINFEEGNSQGAEVTVHNLAGGLVYEGNIHSSQTKINLQTVANGHYIVRLRRENAVLEKKVFISN